MSAFALTNVITLDGYKYAVKSNTYTRTWIREFSTQLAANIVRLTYVDRGPGVETYSMIIEVRDWPADSLPYRLGVTQSWSQQLQNLEASYGKINKSLQFVDPFGQAPVIPGTSTTSGIYFLDLTETIPQYATNDTPGANIKIELKNATGIVN